MLFIISQKTAIVLEKKIGYLNKKGQLIKLYKIILSICYNFNYNKIRLSRVVYNKI